MIRRCTCILLRELQIRHHPLAVEDSKSITGLSNLFKCSPQHVQITANQMIDAGSRYHNLEMSLGLGIALVLGCKVADSTYVFYRI